LLYSYSVLVDRCGIDLALEGGDHLSGDALPIDFIGRTTLADQLKKSLDASSSRTRSIADRVARATAEAQGFSLPVDPAAGTADPMADAAGEGASTGPIDVDAEMVNLADEQLRYEATAKFLEKTYAGLREALK
jgi:flagellar basal body rod protein FlgB